MKNKVNIKKLRYIRKYLKDNYQFGVFAEIARENNISPQCFNQILSGLTIPGNNLANDLCLSFQAREIDVFPENIWSKYWIYKFDDYSIINYRYLKLIKKIIDKLPEREKFIISEWENNTLRGLSIKIGRTRERVRQIYRITCQKIMNEFYETINNED
jgi:hypothetical protein